MSTTVETHKVRMPILFNEWMRRYTQEPERFEREWQSVQMFLESEKAGETPSYGQQCTAYIELLASEIFSI